MQKKFLQKLLKEIPGFEAKGILDPVSASRLRDFCSAEAARADGQTFSVLFSVLGALLIASGIALIFAKNWDFLPRTVKSVLAFLPLMAGQALLVKKILEKDISRAWREGLGAYLPMAFAACLGLIGQIYHLPSDIQSFYWICLIATGPLIYLLQSMTASAFYFFFLISWALMSQKDGGSAFWFWPLMAGVLPFYLKLVKEEAVSNQRAIFSWLLALALTVGTGISLEKSLPGLWTAVYAALFAAIYSMGLLQTAKEEGFLRNPFRLFGGAGLIILCFMFAQNWVWRETGWLYYRDGRGYQALAGYVDYVMLAVFFGTAIFFFKKTKNIAQVNLPEKLFILFPFVVLIMYAFEGYFPGLWLPVICFNFYLLGISIGLMVEGIRLERQSILNFGMLIFLSHFVSRFFDWDMSFLVRGIVFLVLGSGFLSANLWMAKKKRMGEKA